MTFPSTLDYGILCARGFPFFFVYFPIFFYFPILISLNLELVPPCRIAIRNATSLAIGLLCWCTSGAFLRVSAIGIGWDRSGVGVLAIGQQVVQRCYFFKFRRKAVATTPPSKVLLYKTELYHQPRLRSRW